MKSNYPSPLEGIMLRLMLAAPVAIAISYLWNISFSFVFTGTAALAAAILILGWPWEIALLLLPGLLILLLVHGIQNSWTVAHTLSCAFLGVVLLRVFWWWRESQHRRGTDREDTGIQYRRGMQFGLAGMLWSVALLSVVGACIMEIQKWRVKSAEDRQLRKELVDEGARWMTPIYGGENITLRGEWGDMKSEEPLIAFLRDRARARGRISKLDLSMQPVSDASLEVIGQRKGLFYLDLRGTDITDQGLRHLARLELCYLDLSDTNVTDAGVSSLPNLARRNVWNPSGYLNLSGTDISDAALKSLAALEGLWQLDVSDTNITDAGLPALARCERLGRLDLSGTKITNAGLTSLAQIENLKRLTLNRTALTDDDVEEIAQLQNLSELVLSDSSLSDTALDRLEELMPNTKIWRSTPPE